ncbi:hypothetical protein QP938_05995 [Porticoccaceae bacterium LTM1]|nr:hypothetical protein QP938_05995 [Porticoccaceae bacterium LTM1]
MDKDILLVYDKECPICDYYCLKVRIEESVGRLVLVNARESCEVMDEITAQGLDIDQGMVLKLNGQIYYGPDAIYMLTKIGGKSGMFNRLNSLFYGSQIGAGVFYPISRFFRNLLLKALGKTKINNLNFEDNEKF